ncbi:MFS transporter, partial [Aeromonas media]
MNNKLPPRWLVVGLMMFPQIVETIYSPVLTQIATQFRVSEGQASQTLSVYFLAFAVGVVCWGRLCDLIGRRPAMLAGLLTYG